MALRAGMVTIDCADPRALAEFWTHALDYTIVSDWDGQYLLLRPAPDAPASAPPAADDTARAGVPPAWLTLGLQRVPEPRTGKNRVHLDLQTDNRLAEVDRLVGLGAKIIGEQHLPGFAWSVLEDPQGNVFCVGADE